MRLAIHKDDSGYKPEFLSRQPNVTCNGVKIELCVMADEEQGIAVALLTNGLGAPLVNRMRTDIRKKTYSGKIKIEFDEGKVLQDIIKEKAQ